MQEGTVEPYKFTADVREQFLECLEAGQTKMAACQTVGISRSTLYNYMKANSDFKQDVEVAETSAIDVVEDALFNKAKNGNVTAQIFYLKCRKPDRWNDKPRNDDMIPIGEAEERFEQLIEIVFKHVPEDGRDALIEDLRRVGGLESGDRQRLEAPDSEPD